MKKFIRNIIEITPLIVAAYLLYYVFTDLAGVKAAINSIQYYENNDTVMSQILNEVAQNNTLLLFVAIMLIAIFVGIMLIIERLSDNRSLLEEIKEDLAKIPTEALVPTPKQVESNYNEYMPKQ